MPLVYSGDLRKETFSRLCGCCSWIGWQFQAGRYTCELLTEFIVEGLSGLSIAGVKDDHHLLQMLGFLAAEAEYLAQEHGGHKVLRETQVSTANG
uniref:Uncharacterized protein n=1 Tax=Anguilla anguilla TaxID=7936 RepID=A0A0E9XDL3_ANGAN